MPQKNTNAKSFNTSTLLIAITSTLIMGTVPLWVKLVDANAVTIGLVRLMITVSILIGLLYFRRAFQSIKTTREWRALFIIGLVFGGHWLSYFLSIKLASASLGAISISTFGIHLLILNWAVKKQRPSLFDIFTVLCCFIGCLLVVPEFTFESQATFGMLLGVFSAFLYACLPLLHQSVQHLPTLTRTWGQSFFAFAVFLPLAGYSQWSISLNDWLILGILGVFCTFIAHSLWVKASTELPGIITSLVYYLYLPVAILLSAIFLDEKLAISTGIGAVLIIGANVSQSVLTWRKERSIRNTLNRDRQSI